MTKAKKTENDIFRELHDMHPDKAVLMIVMDCEYPQKAIVIRTGTWSFLPFIRLLVQSEMDQEYDEMNSLEDEY